MDISPVISSSAMLQAQLEQKHQLNIAHTPATKAKVAAHQFEAILTRQFLGKSMETLMGGGDSAAGSIYGYMLSDMLSEKLSQGTGMGLGNMIEQQLTPHLSTSTTLKNLNNKTPST
jgi:Rod binding domain-containing protein